MAWQKVEKAPLRKCTKRSLPDGLWFHCKSCGEIIYRKEIEENQYVCTKCSEHYPIAASKRLGHFLDEGTFEERDDSLKSLDPLEFYDVKSYSQRLKDTVEKLQMQDSLLCGSGQLGKHRVQVAVFDFRFMGGSMGSVVGEKIARTFLRAHKSKESVIIFSTSGGARMQEGLLSLMQMAKTCSALNLFLEVGLPFISVMTHPTTGGVAASYAMLGDVNIAEPGALIGFAGPRVIQQTIGQKLPDGFQKSEYLMEHGMLDCICDRQLLRDKVIHILDILSSGPK